MADRSGDELGRPSRSWFQELQGLDDAIAFRTARLAQPCGDCATLEDRCDDHACDVALLAGYRQRAHARVRPRPPASTERIPA